MPPTPPSPSHTAVESLIFGNSEIGDGDPDDPLADLSNEPPEADSTVRHTRSMYVDLFEGMCPHICARQKSLILIKCF